MKQTFVVVVVLVLLVLVLVLLLSSSSSSYYYYYCEQFSFALPEVKWKLVEVKKFGNFCLTSMRKISTLAERCHEIHRKCFEGRIIML